MRTPNNTLLVTDAKTKKRIMNLKKSLEQIMMLTLIGCIIPIMWPIMMALGPVYALQRRNLLKHPQVDKWLNDNSRVDFKRLAQFPTLEGGVSRIKISGLRPWIPVLLSVIAVVVVTIMVKFI